MKHLFLAVVIIFCSINFCAGQVSKNFKFVDNNKIVSEFTSINSYDFIKSRPGHPFAITKKFDRNSNSTCVTFKNKWNMYIFSKIDGEYVLIGASITSNRIKFLNDFKILALKSFVLKKAGMNNAPNNITFLSSEGTETLTFFFKNNLLIRVGYSSQIID